MKPMTVRNKPKTQFQSELDAVMEKRRSKGLSTGFSTESDSGHDDYEDDFEVEEETSTKYIKTTKSATKTKQSGNAKPSNSRHARGDGKWNVPDFLKDDPYEDDFLVDQKSFLKTARSPIDVNSRNKNYKLTEDKDESEDSGDDPILKLLKKPDKKETNKKQRSPSPQHQSKMPALSPLPRSTPSPRQHDQKASPTRDLKSPTPGRSSPYQDKQSPLMRDLMRDSLDNNKESLPKPKKRSTSELKQTKTMDSNITDFLLGMDPTPKPRGKRTVDKKSSESRSRSRSPDPEFNQKELKSKPDYKSRSQTSSPKHDNSSFPKRSKSPGHQDSLELRSSVHKSKSESPLTRSRNDSPSLHKSMSDSPLRKSLSDRPPSSAHNASEDLLSSFPNLSLNKKLVVTASHEDYNASARTKQTKTNDADDLLALFGEKPKTSLSEQKTTMLEINQQSSTEKLNEKKTPAETVAQKTHNEMTVSTKQRKFKQLNDNVISNIAEHNEKMSETSLELSLKQTKDVELKSKKAKKKSYRNPPEGYQGLGSLTALKELNDTKGSPRLNESARPTSSDDIRKQVYLDWLAKREVELKARKKKQLEEAKIAQEKEQKEKEDKEMESTLTRRAWSEKKEEMLQAQIRKKKAEEKRKEKEAEEKEKSKQKTKLEAEKVRQRMLEEHKKRHHEEMKKKKKEEQEIKRKERERKDDNKKALNDWMATRSKTWVQSRKKEEREKVREKKKVEKEKEEDEKAAIERYQEWRRKKDEETKRQMRETRIKNKMIKNGTYFEEDELPPWSPSNKLIATGR